MLVYCTDPNEIFGVSDKESFKPVSSATETSLKIEISPVASLHIMILSKKRITKALIRLCRCAGWSAPLLFANTEDRFSHVVAHILSGSTLITKVQVYINQTLFAQLQETFCLFVLFDS